MNPGIYLSLGTNLGNREKNLTTALSLLRKSEDVEVIKLSGIYETIPIGPGEQQNYWNAVACLKTQKKPHALLQIIHGIEQSMGRRRRIRWGERTIDIDILIYNDLHIEEDNLHVPHPRLHERSFVLQPLADLNPDLIIRKKTVTEWLSLAEPTIIKKIAAH